MTPVPPSENRRNGHRRTLRILALAVAATGAGLFLQGIDRDPEAAPLPAATFDERALGHASDPEPPDPTPIKTYGPRRLGIPALGIDAPVQDEDIAGSGALVIPGDPATVGRWRDGPEMSATTGTTLLAGHVNFSGVGRGALAELHRIRPRELVVTTDAAGQVYRWRVSASSVHHKDALPAFEATGRRQLALITCGGPVLQTGQGRSYRDNVVVYADPAP
ncbi:Sortase family protein [Austwickia chelonae]|uniref:Peptidase C60 family protein n=1 Tax=Austwickia chelonae NBRC 105200 TaxID=1184607 RepID=K6VNM4_9MICO|nr:class F sortase [Austwickia chelonae]GAB78344.1 hypothetical protein AUCHE_08_05910 [Austwickia chelonae NBRC 105200]SEW01705.1 Sortase family protein [Austwickia chelonae]